MSDETSAPVPPGWVRLTGHDGRPLLVRANRIDAVTHRDGAGALIATMASDFVSAESAAEVAALIAEAQRAQARSTVVAAFTSTAHGDSIMVVTADGSCWAPCEGRMQPVIAGIDGGAIDDLEREAGR